MVSVNMTRVECLMTRANDVVRDSEPTSALDAGTVKTVETHLRALPGSEDSSVQAIIWVTHSDDQTHNATRLIHVGNGEVKEETLPEA